MISHAPRMPQAPYHAKSSTNLLQLNNGVVPAHIADSKRHDADDSNIVQAIICANVLIIQQTMN